MQHDRDLNFGELRDFLYLNLNIVISILAAEEYGFNHAIIICAKDVD